jgi:two-component system NtrC family sensor kinase
METARLDILKKRLKRTVLTHAVLPAVLLSISLCGYAIHAVERENRDACAAELRTLSATWAALVQREFRSAVSALEVLADAGHGPGTPQSDLERSFEAIHRGIPWLDGASLMTAQGAPIAQTGVLPATISDHRGEAMTRKDRPLMVTDAETGPDGLPRFRIILLPGEGRNMIVCASVNAVRFSALFDRTRFGRTGEVFLIDQSGTLRTASVTHGAIGNKVDALLMRTATPDADILVREFKETRLWSRAEPIDAVPGWRLVVQRDERELLQPRDAMLLRLAAPGLLGMAALAALAFAAMKRVRSLQDCMDAELARMAEHDMHVRKLDAVSQLGVGIAHEVNNPLAIIGEEAGWMQDVLRRESFRDNPDAGELQDSLRQIVGQTARSREITHKLLSFGGRTDGIIRDTDVNVLVGDVATLRRREASGKHIEILVEPAGELPVILSEPALLRQLLANLLTNSMDAMPQGGAITISTAPADDGGVSVRVRDTGFGIPRENLSRVFDPFFTTKPPGKGAGLGLSICHGIMQRLGGRIFAESVPGTGTTITVELPLEACARTS